MEVIVLCCNYFLFFYLETNLHEIVECIVPFSPLYEKYYLDKVTFFLENLYRIHKIQYLEMNIQPCKHLNKTCLKDTADILRIAIFEKMYQSQEQEFVQFRSLKNKSCVKLIGYFTHWGEDWMEIMLRTSETNLLIPGQFAQQFNLENHFQMNLVQQIPLLLQSGLYMLKISSSVNKTQEDKLSVVIRQSCKMDVAGKYHF